MGDLSENENETSAQELMALVVPKDEDEDEEEDVGNENSAFMNDTASSIGDAVAAVLADAGPADVEDGDENRDEGPSDLNLDGPEPTPPTCSMLPVETDLGGHSINTDIIGGIKTNNIDDQQSLLGMATIPAIPPNLLQQAGNAAVFAAAPYIIAAATGGLSVAPNTLTMQPQETQQQQPLLQLQNLQLPQRHPPPSLPLQFANPAFLLGAAGNNSSSLLQNVSLNPALLQQNRTGGTSPAPTGINDNGVISPLSHSTLGVQLPQQLQQPPLLDPATFLSAALLMQNSAMLMPGGIPQQVMAQTYNNNNINPSVPMVTTSNGADAGTISLGNSMFLPNNPMFPTAALQQLVPMFAAAMGAVPALVQQPQEQSQPQQQQLPPPAAASTSPPAVAPSVQNNPQRISIPLYLDHDENCLTAYQCFLRKQIELFEAGNDELQGTAQGRNTPLHRGQIGIRCRHCAHLPKAARARGGVYYSRTIDGVCKH
jgi:hypothetical protein